MEEIRLGTIGSGVIVHSILDNVKLTDGIRLEAVYSRTREKGGLWLRNTAHPRFTPIWMNFWQTAK